MKDSPGRDATIIAIEVTAMFADKDFARCLSWNCSAGSR
jgi:hypothetical protein